MSHFVIFCERKIIHHIYASPAYNIYTVGSISQIVKVNILFKLTLGVKCK